MIKHCLFCLSLFVFTRIYQLRSTCTPLVKTVFPSVKTRAKILFIYLIFLPCHNYSSYHKSFVDHVMTLTICKINEILNNCFKRNSLDHLNMMLIKIHLYWLSPSVPILYVLEMSSHNNWKEVILIIWQVWFLTLW